MHSCTIRSAAPPDALALHAMLSSLEETILPFADFEVVFRANLAHPFIGYWLAEFDQRPIGMISCHIQGLLHHAGRVAEIQEMFVEEEFRSRGIGKRLVATVECFAREHQAQLLEVTTNQKRTATHRFYVREGFVASHIKLVKSLGNE